jgi:hypothetical protein
MSNDKPAIAPVDVPGVVEAERTDSGPAVLVRPDGYIAWAGPTSDRAGLATALSRWSRETSQDDGNPRKSVNNRSLGAV